MDYECQLNLGLFIFDLVSLVLWRADNTVASPMTVIPVLGRYKTCVVIVKGQTV